MAVAVLSALAVPTPTASATTYYEYWSYWHKPPGTSSWQYSTVGASGYYLSDRGPQVEGWRYAVGTASPSDPQPRPTNVSYGDYCHDTGQSYQVLLVVDYGNASSAPSGPVYSCYGFSDTTSGYVVLTQQHTERDSGGLICAIDNYPRSGCGDTVSSPAPKHKARTPKPAAVAPSTQTSPQGVTTTAPPPRAARTGKVSSKPTASTDPTTSSSATPTETTSAQPTLRPFTGAPTASRSSFPFGLVLAIAAVIALSAAAATRRRRRG
jgi:hypothetical protein